MKDVAWEQELLTCILFCEQQGGPSISSSDICTCAQVLWLSRVGLQGLDGISALPSLRELYVSFNHISTLEAVQVFVHAWLTGQTSPWLAGPDPLFACSVVWQATGDLEVIDLEGNCITDLKEIDMLGLCGRLETVSLEGNPVALLPGYRAYVARAVPQMRLLDDMPVEGEATVLSVQDANEVQREEAIVSCAVRSARVGFDSHEFEEVEAAVAEGLEVRPGTACLRVSLSSLRPSTTGRLAGSRGEMSARPSSAYRPQSASAHGAMQRSGLPMSGGGLHGGVKSMNAAGGLFWKKHRVGTSNAGHDAIGAEEEGSELTRGSGANGLMGGGAAAALRRRKDKPPSPLQGRSGLSSAQGSSLRQSIGEREMNVEQLLVCMCSLGAELKLHIIVIVWICALRALLVHDIGFDQWNASNGLSVPEALSCASVFVWFRAV